MSTPRFVVIKQHLLKQIEQGHWPEHAPVPSENELAEQFAVSRMTARRAVSELVEQGVLVRQQGKGTYVADHRAQTPMLAIRNIADEIRSRGNRWHAKVLALTGTVASNGDAVGFAIEPGTPLFRSQIVHLEDDRPVQLEQRLVNPALAEDYLAQDFTQITPHEYLCSVAPLTAADHIVEAIAANAEQAQQLQIALHSPCLKISRQTRSRSGVVSIASLIYPGSRYRLGAHLDF
ncbi:histidine utilization repressor [Ferrimonas senticii]|uniref:histidine utilization repressor n=1 Tax=Ferrimonas senticii TaxID=394566 RepID=UPI0004132FEB|nr:histidine utilization repressor [Ferrimonas senticii]